MMSPRDRLVVLIASAANFIVIADATIVIIALPSMASLGFTPTTLPWVINAYAFVFGGGLLLGGVIADRYGPVRPFVVGMLVFAAGSVVCALAGSVEPLLIGRMVQGAGGALCCPAALALATRSGRTRPTGPPGDRSEPPPESGSNAAKALALWSASGAVAVAVAPILGGALTAALGWPSVFWLPALVCVGAGLAALRIHEAVPEARAPAIGACRGVARVAAACGVLALGSAAVVGVSYVGTVWLQHTVGLSPAAAGLALLPLSAGIVAGSAFAPALIRRRGVRWVAVVGLAMGALGTVGLLPPPSLAGFVVALAVLGTGFGLQSVPVSLVATTVPHRLATAGLAGARSSRFAVPPRLATAGLAGARSSRFALPGGAGIASAAYQTAGQLGAAIGLASFTALGAWQATRAGAGPDASYQVVVGAAAVALMLALVVASVGWRSRGYVPDRIDAHWSASGITSPASSPGRSP
jgi:predicted MFS family arabinose efflux permease